MKNKKTNHLHLNPQMNAASRRSGTGFKVKFQMELLNLKV